MICVAHQAFGIGVQKAGQVHAAEEQVTQFLIALMINAVEAMPNGGQLGIKTWDDPTVGSGHVFLRVSDTGTGIPREIQDRIFDPFFSRREGGTGLGLTVVRRIVEAHNGSIQVQSSKGKGTEVTMRFPVDARVEGTGNLP